MPRIAVFGAGAIGCWVGGRLAAGGADVTLIGRSRVLAELETRLRVSDLHGNTREVKPALATDATAAANADIVLVTVKSAATAERRPRARAVLAPRRHRRQLAERRAQRRVSCGMALPDRTRARRHGAVQCRRRRAAGEYHQASGGTLMFERPRRDRAAHRGVHARGLAFELRDDMPAVQWSKLVLNLNNAINALSGKPLAEELARSRLPSLSRRVPT